MGVSENSVPLNPMVLLIIIPIKWLFHWEYTIFLDKPIYELIYVSLCMRFAIRNIFPAGFTMDSMGPIISATAMY